MTAHFEGLGERTLLLNARRIDARQEILLAIEDITERRQVLRELEKKTDQVQQLASRLTMAEQQERERVARTLHDGLQQQLYGTRLKMSSLRKQIQKGVAPASTQEECARQVETLEEELREILQEIRELSVSLSPPVLEREGLTATLEWVKSYMQETRELEVELKAEEEFPMEKGMRVLLFHTTRSFLPRGSFLPTWPSTQARNGRFLQSKKKRMISSLRSPATEKASIPPCLRKEEGRRPSDLPWLASASVSLAEI